jgi:hypothetical protein
MKVENSTRTRSHERLLAFLYYCNNELCMLTWLDRWCCCWTVRTSCLGLRRMSVPEESLRAGKQATVAFAAKNFLLAFLGDHDQRCIGLCWTTAGLHVQRAHKPRWYVTTRGLAGQAPRVLTQLSSKALLMSTVWVWLADCSYMTMGHESRLAVTDTCISRSE